MKIWHPWNKWECYRAGFFDTVAPIWCASDGDVVRELYRAFLSDIPRFNAAMDRVTSEWLYSCEHWLTNESMNRIAWLGQASACIDLSIPACFRGGFKLLTVNQQRAANEAALIKLEQWLEEHSRGGSKIHRHVEGTRLSG